MSDYDVTIKEEKLDITIKEEKLKTLIEWWVNVFEWPVTVNELNSWTSSYQLWLQEWYTGTPADFMNWLASGSWGDMQKSVYDPLDKKKAVAFQDEVTLALWDKVDTEVGKQLSQENYTTVEKNKLGTLNNYDDTAVVNAIANKVDKVTGKVLSDNNYSTAEKNKVANLPNDTSAELLDKVDKVIGKDLSDENYTTAEKQKLAGLESSKFKWQFLSLVALQNAIGIREIGAWAYVDEWVGKDVVQYNYDSTDDDWFEIKGTTTAETPVSIKLKYESNPDTNAYTDAEKWKLASITAIFTTALKGIYDNAVDWIGNNGATLLGHLSLTNNPHEVTKWQVGLWNVNNTSDANKPVSIATQAWLDLKSDKLVITNPQTTSYQILLSDTDKVVNITSVTGVTLTIPTNAVTAFPIGTVIIIKQWWVGQVTIDWAGVTIKSAWSKTKTKEIDAEVFIRKDGTDTRALVGNLA